MDFLYFISLFCYNFVIDTTFAPWQQDNGHVVLNTKPKILCCDLRLSPGESKTCKFLTGLIKFSFEIKILNNVFNNNSFRTFCI